MLAAGQMFPGGWSVARCDAGALRLERSAALEWKDALRRVGFLLVPLVLATVTLAGTWEVDWGLKLMAWPVAALLYAVVALGVLSATRAVLRARAGVCLEVSTAAHTVTGFCAPTGRLSDYTASALTVPFEQVACATLTTFRGASPSAAALVQVCLVLSSGQRLLGPELAAPDAEQEVARERLAPLSAELARRLACRHDVAVISPPT